jgi:hypothetical protein
VLPRHESSSSLISSAALPPVGSHALLGTLCSQFVDFLFFRVKLLISFCSCGYAVVEGCRCKLVLLTYMVYES